LVISDYVIVVAGCWVYFHNWLVSNLI